MKKDKNTVINDWNIGLYGTLSILVIGLFTAIVAAIAYGVFEEGLIIEAGISLQIPAIESVNN